MTDKDLIPMRSQPRIVLLVLALLLAAGVLFAVLHKGQQVSRQADKALVTQTEQFDHLRDVPPALLKWREVKQIPVTVRSPACLAVNSSGQVCVGGDNALEQVGAKQYPLPFAATAVSYADTLHVASRDRLYAYDAKSSAWLPLTPSLGAQGYVTGIVATGKDLWVADSGHRVVWHYDAKGKLLGSFGGREGKDKSKGLIVPSPHLKVVLKPDGNLVVNNPGRLRVDTYSPSGALKSSFGRASVDISGFCGCCNPIDVALLPDGRVVTAEKGLPRVKVYKADGTLDSVVVGPTGLSSRCEPQIAVDPQGQILVLDAPAQVVRVFERKQ